MVREDTIKELTTVTITQLIGLPTHASVELTRKEIAKKAVAIKTRYEPFPEVTRYGFTAAIMLVAYYQKRGNHARCSVDISSTWHPCHVWPSHRRKNKRDQQGENRGGLGSPPGGTWSLPWGRGCYEAPHHNNIRCILARENRGRCPWFHPQDSKINAGALAHAVHETRQYREAYKAQGNIISMADGRRRLDLLQKSG